MKKKKRKKLFGFTLIELLAVILVLGVIALIATATIGNIVKTSQKGAAEVSAKNYLSAVSTKMQTDELTGNTSELVKNGVVFVEDVNSVEMSGRKPTSGMMIISKGKVISAELVVNGRTVLCDDTETCNAIDGYIYYVGEGSANKVNDGTKERPSISNAYLKYVVDANTLVKYQACIFDGTKEVCLFPDEREVSLRKLYDAIGIEMDSLYPTDGTTMKRSPADPDRACLFFDGDVQCFFGGKISLSVRNSGHVESADMEKLYDCSTKTKSCNKLSRN